jgi:uncharacterized protein YegP (UPF0339 family)
MIEIYDDKAGEVRWSLIGDNGEPMAQGEGHRDVTDCLRAIEAVELAFKADPEIRIVRPGHVTGGEARD